MAHLASDDLVVEATRGTYTMCGQLPGLCGLSGMFTKVATDVCDSREFLTSAR